MCIICLHFKLIEAEWHIYASLNIFGSGSGLSPDRHQAIIWSKAELLLIGPLGTNFNEILIEIHILSLKKNPFENVFWKMAAICLGLNVLAKTLSDIKLFSKRIIIYKVHFAPNLTGPSP